MDLQLRDLTMTTEITVPADFPRGIPAAVPGVHPKLCVRLIDGKYVSGWTNEELYCRYDNCEDLARQLVSYVTRKAIENPDWTREFNLNRLEKALASKGQSGVWDITTDEQVWIMARTKAILGWEKG